MVLRLMLFEYVLIMSVTVIAFFTCCGSCNWHLNISMA